MGSIGAGASDDGHDAGSCDVEGAVGAGVGGWPAEEVADWLGSTAGLGVSAVADFAGITGAEILEFTEAELAEIAGLPKAKAKLLHKRLRAPVATPGYTTNPTTPTRAGGEAPEGAAAAEIAPEKPRRIVPFVPLPSVPIKKPWVMGVETGLKLSEAGNTVVHDGNGGLDESTIPTECPELAQPANIHFMVINLDRSKNRRRKMRQDFADRGLPAFERIPGVIITAENVNQMTPPRLSKQLKLADFGCAMAHRRAWQKIVAGPHDWAIVLEDDAELIDSVNYTVMPKVPVDADMVLFRAGTVMRWQPVCTKTSVMRAYWGFGMVAYLLSKAGAQRLLTATADGLSTPLDGKIWYSSTVYVTRTDYIWHPPCANPCPSSVRTWLNKELDPSTEYPD